jgi:hypothetical protein
VDSSPENPSNEENLLPISSFLDQYRNAADLIDLADRLASDSGARTFYRQARALDGTLDVLEQLPSREPPVAVWKKIAETAELDPGPTRWGTSGRASRPRLVLVAAAVALAIFAGWALFVGPRTAQREQGEAAPEASLAQIEIGARAGEMTANRFFALTTEILEADRSYRRELLKLMNSIEREMASEESATEVRTTSDFSDRQSDPRIRGVDEFESQRGDRLRIDLF